MRLRTSNNYQYIKEDVTEFIRNNWQEPISMDDYMRQSDWSRRHVQRALSFCDTSWRKLLAEERERHG